ncbi:MAG: glutamate racemase [Bacteroidota bacterium]
MTIPPPIGIFDSGLGGLSVWREIRHALPAESLIYVADQAYCPYGRKPAGEIRDRAYLITDFLIKKGCKMVVVACNTATAAAIQDLRQRYTLPFVGMEPALKPAVLQSKTGKVGILATQGTLRGGHFLRNLSQVPAEKEVLVQEGEGLVEAVERGEWDHPQTRKLLEKYLHPLLEKGADQVVLGCTHYPFLAAPIQEILAGQATLIDPAPAIARRVEALLTEGKALAPSPGHGGCSFFTNLSPADFQMSFQRLCPAIPSEDFHFAYSPELA